MIVLAEIIGAVYRTREGRDLVDSKGVIRIRKTKDRQHNGQKKKY